MTDTLVAAGDAGSLVTDLLQRMSALREELVRATAPFEGELAALHPRCQESGRNLLHYLTLRHHDLRWLHATCCSGPCAPTRSA